MKLNSLKAEQIKNGEISIEDAYKIYGKENVDAAVSELKKSDEEILSQYTVDKMKSAIFENNHLKVCPRTTFSVFKNPRSRFGFSYSSVSKVAGLAAILVVVLGVAFTQFSTKSKSAETTQHLDVRSKGALVHGMSEVKKSQLILYKKTSDGAVVLKSGDKAAEGDFIQIAYYPGENKYGIIFSVDGNKNVTKHFPENTWTASPLGNETDLLDFSYELDDAPEFEDFIFLASEKGFSISEKEAYKVFADENYFEKKYNDVSKVEVLLNK